MKYVRMKRLIYRILLEHKNEDIYIEDIINDMLFNAAVPDKIFWYFVDNLDKAFDELYVESKIYSPDYHRVISEIL